MASMSPATISHWVGLAVVAPIVLITGIAVAGWLKGEFPPTVGLNTVVPVVMAAAAASVLLYLPAAGSIGWGPGRRVDLLVK